MIVAARADILCLSCYRIVLRRRVSALLSLSAHRQLGQPFAGAHLPARWLRQVTPIVDTSEARYRPMPVKV
jgi:hypothetical protein